MSDVLTEQCGLCGVTLSTGSCEHLMDLGEGRVGMPRSVWEGLVADRARLRDDAVPEHLLRWHFVTPSDLEGDLAARALLRTVCRTLVGSASVRLSPEELRRILRDEAERLEVEVSP